MHTQPRAIDRAAAARPPAPIDGASDVALLRQLIDGSEGALAGLYDRYGEVVFAAALRASRDRSVAAEVVQDTFLTLWNRAERFDPSRGALPAWLLTIARNRAIDHLRSAARHQLAGSFASFGHDADDHSIDDWLMTAGRLVAAAAPEPAPEIALTDKETRGSIDDALDALTPLERSVIVLAYDEGLSQSEIAGRLGWPIGTVKTRTRRALRRLRDRLDPCAGALVSRVAAASARSRTAAVPSPCA
jgi:RNA polymerase sigma-70 factor, ECF subfamily